VPIPVGVQLDRIVGREFRWRIGGIHVRVCSVDRDLTLMVPPAVEPFLDSGDAVPDLTIRARWGEIEPEAPGPMVFDSGGLWKLHQAGPYHIFRFQTNHFGPLPYKSARFSRDWSDGEVVLHRPYFDPHQPIYPLEYPLDELVCTRRLAAHAGVELHACGVVDQGVGYAFVGQSGAGKSTTARLWNAHPGVTVLSDDRVIVRCDATGVTMHGTPWHGDEALIAQASVPLLHIFVLRQGTQPYVDPLRGAAAVAQLFSCTFPPFHSGEALADTLHVLDLIAQRARCSVLWFRPDHSAVEYVRSLR
jgi:hypothetical protein